MRIPTRAALVAVVLLGAAPALAVINKPISLKDDALREEFIFVAAVESVAPDGAAVTFKVEEKLKGNIPVEKMTVVLTNGTEEAQKGKHQQILLDRLEVGRKLVVFSSVRGKRYNAIAFMEGTWFSLQGSVPEEGKAPAPWRFLNCEPNLRGTFKGTTAELRQVLVDALAKKADPPAPNFKEPPGYGPPVEKKPCGASVGGPLFGVMPSLALIGPMAIIAAMFPGVAARMAVGMRKWRAFLVVASANSTLALVYYFLGFYKLLPDTPALGLTAFTLYLMAITVGGLVWAGQRYRRLAATDPAVTGTPSRVELWALAGLTLFAGLIAASSRFFGPWSAAVEIPMREFTFIAVGLLAATAYAGYRAVTPAVDYGPDGSPPPLRLSVSGESVGLGALLLCGFTAVLLSVGGGTARTVLTAPDGGEVKLTDTTVFELAGADQVLSGITVDGDRLYFGTSTLRLSSQDGSLVCMDRNTGAVHWKFEADDDLRPVFCTPTVADGRVYFGEGLHEHKRCRFFCLDTQGKPAWAKPIPTGSHTEGTPLVADGKVYFTAGDDGLMCADARTGEKKWEPFGGAAKGLHVDGPPARAGRRLFVGSGLYTKAVLAVDADTGTELWRTPVPYRSFGRPLVIDDRVVFGLGTGNLLKDVETYPEEGDAPAETKPGGAVVCVEAATGQVAWQYDLTRSVHTPLAADGLYVYAASRDGHVHCLNRKNGKLRWKTPVGAVLTAGVAVAADEDGFPVAAYAVSTDGTVACLNPHTGRPYWVRDMQGHTGKVIEDVVSTPAVVADGKRRTVYVGATLKDRNNPAKTAAVFRFDDATGE